MEGWGWDALPDAYKRSTHLCADSTALSEQHKLSQSTTEESIIDQGMNSNSEDTTTPVQDILPKKKVKYCTACDLTLISGLIAHIIPDSLYSCHTLRT